MQNSLCPYCVCVLGQVGNEDTKEHVFVKALGGRCTIRACRDCNSRLGHEVEGRLQRRGGLLAFENALRTSTGPDLQVVAGDGRLYETDLRTGDYRAREVIVSEERDGNELRRTLSGPAEQVQPILEGIAAKYPGLDVEEALASAVSSSSPVLSASIEVDLELEARLAVKIALASATYCLGDDFVRSSLAIEFRSVLNGESPALFESAEKIEPALGIAGIGAAPDERQCILLSMPATAGAPARTVVCVRLFGRTLPAGQVLVARAPCPEQIVLLHEASTGQAECFDGFVSRVVNATIPAP